jgi:hypothetical protein
MGDDVQRFELAQGVDHIPFELGDEVFHAVGEMAGGVILDFAAASSGGDPDAQLTPEEAAAQGTKVLNAVTEFLRKAIVPEDWDRWVEVTHRTGRGQVVSLPVLMSVATFLAEQYANPTGELSPSTSPPTRSGRASTGGRSREVTTYSRPKRPARSAL